MSSEWPFPADMTGPSSLADVGQKRHEPRPLHRVLHRPLERRAAAAALAAEQLALAGAHLLQRRHVLVVHERRARAALLRAETAAVLAAGSAELLADHRG